jgi:TRAP-type C4-dicarboxylate transport system permease small subunit
MDWRRYIMKSTILKVEHWTTKFSLAAACAMLALAACLGLFQIVMRFVIEEPAEWTEVLIRFSLIWMVFLGIPTAFRLGAMVSVDVLYRWGNPLMRRVLDGFVALASLALIVIIIAVGWDYAKRGQVQSVIGLENVTMFWAYLALPAGGCFAVLSIIANFLDPKQLELENQQ